MSDFGIWVWNLKTLLSNLKSAPSNLSKYEISRKKKMLGTKNCFFGVFLFKNVLFGYFWTRFFKNSIVIFEITTLKFDQKCLIWVFLH